jgi:hypothetical protein
MSVEQLSMLFSDTVPFILAPRLIIDIWDSHANDKCVRVSTTFEDCVCLTSPPTFDPEEQDSQNLDIWDRGPA